MKSGECQPGLRVGRSTQAWSGDGESRAHTLPWWRRNQGDDFPAQPGSAVQVSNLRPGIAASCRARLSAAALETGPLLMTRRPP